MSLSAASSPPATWTTLGTRRNAPTPTASAPCRPAQNDWITSNGRVRCSRTIAFAARQAVRGSPRLWTRAPSRHPRARLVVLMGREHVQLVQHRQAAEQREQGRDHAPLAGTIHAARDDERDLHADALSSACSDGRSRRTTPPALELVELVAALERRRAMRDQHDGAPAAELAQQRDDVGLGGGIERARRLVEH